MLRTVLVLAALASACSTAPPPPPPPAPPAAPPPSASAAAAPAPLDCTRQDRCRTHGACSAAADRTCVVGGDADCAASDACVRDGACTARFGPQGRTCAKSCRHDPACAESGQCKDDGAGTCEVGSDADCRASRDCARTGACALRSAACMPASQQDCKRSELCRTGGYCAYREGHRCLAPRELRCDCAPPGHPSPDALKAHQACLARGGGWGPLCGPLPP